MSEKKSFKFYIAVTGLLFFAFTFVYFLIGWGRSVEYHELSIIGRVIIFSGIIGFFAFWFSVLAHFFENQNLNHKVLWGFCLILFSWLSALIYFFKYFLPQKGVRG